MEEVGIAGLVMTGTATEQVWGMTDNIVVNHGRFLRADGSFGALVDVALSYTLAAAPGVAQEVARLADEWFADVVHPDVGVRLEPSPHFVTLAEDLVPAHGLFG